MKLYFAELLNPRKACAVARHLGGPVEFIRVEVEKGQQRRPEFLAINPNGKVPVLVDGDMVLWESNAIMCHLSVRAGADLWPSGARQIEVIRWLSWDAAHFTRHAGALYFENIIKPDLGIGSPDPAAVAEAAGAFQKFAAVLDSHLAGRRYVVGDQLTVADFALGVALPYADRAKLPVGGFPAIQRWHARLQDLPAWRDPFPQAPAMAA